MLKLDVSHARGHAQPTYLAIIHIEVQKRTSLGISSCPDPLDALCQSHIVCLEFVETDPDH